MQVVAERLHPVRKLDRVGHDVAIGIALLGLPAVVDDKVNIAGVAHAVRDHGVGGALDEILIDIRRERVPGVPTHGRGQSEILEFLGKRGGSEAHGRQQEVFFHG